MGNGIARRLAKLEQHLASPYPSSSVQFYYIAVGDGMIWSYLLSIECPASPQPSELQRPCYILVHKPSHI